MKKSLLALAVLGAFAGAASAQTNVTIYGVLDAAVTRTDSDNGASTWTLDSGNFTKNGSRIGFKGSEDIGGGLTALFQLENGFGTDDGNLKQGGRLFGRHAWVGLKSGLGTVKLGRQLTTTFVAADTIDPFGTGMAGDISTVFNVNGARSDNTVSYSLSSGGFSGYLTYAFGEQAGSTSSNRQAGFGLAYENGPLNIQAAYLDVNRNSASATSSGVETSFLGAIYNLGMLNLHAAVQTDETTNAANAKTIDDTNWMIGVSAPVGAAGKFLASYVSRSADVVTGTRDDADKFGIGYIHNLSKRTHWYTSYSRTNDDSAASNDSDVFNIGLQHRF